MPNAPSIQLLPWRDIYPATLQIPEFTEAYPESKYVERLADKDHLCLAAVLDDQIAGFKIGYALDKTTFYSWVGGVLPAFRQMGLAHSLADEMERICKDRGYRILRMKTQNRFKAMLHFAIGNGFHLTEVIQKESPERYRIVLEKRLFDA
ncbi:MAG: GNAT family N-acetyltransferase [Bacteroidota bacterium]